MRETLELFSQLIRTGQAWNLPRCNIRTAHHLIDVGYITPRGQITDAGYNAANAEAVGKYPDQLCAFQDGDMRKAVVSFLAQRASDLIHRRRSRSHRHSGVQVLCSGLEAEASAGGEFFAHVHNPSSILN